MDHSPASRFSVENLSPTSPGGRNEYPFPRPGSSNSRLYPRRGSTASSIHSIGGTLDSVSQWHGFNESGQNAISTLLQPPIVRTGLIPHTSAPASSAHKPPTARDIPPVTLTNIPHVDPSEFKSYLTQVGATYDALQRAKENEEEGGTQLLRKGNKADDFADILEFDVRTPRLSRKSSLASLASLDTPSGSARKKSSSGRRALHAPTPISTVPSVYFEEDFHLENPRTFDVVSERSEVIRPTTGSPDERRASNGSIINPRKALATNAILQEKLSWYMDTIEVHLISSISTASTSFFAALGSLRELHSEAAVSVERIKTLRKELEELDEEMAVGGLKIVNLQRRRENLKQLNDAVQQLKQIVNAVASCESMVENGDVEQALDAIDALEKLIAGEEMLSKPGQHKIQLRDLRGAIALQGVNNDLDVLRYRIGKSFESRFLQALLGDLRRHVDTVSAEDTLQRWSNASLRSRGNHSRETSSQQPTYLTVPDQFRTELLSNLGGLYRAKCTSVATSAFREAVLREVRNIIRRFLPSSNDDDTDSMMSASTVGGARQKNQQEKSMILARNLRSLDPDDAEELLKKTYIQVGETLRRLGTQVKVLLDVTSTLGDPDTPGGVKSPPRSPVIGSINARMSPSLRGNSGRELQEEMHQTLDMSNLLGQAVDIAQDKIVKVLRVRTEQSTHLSVERFLRYFTLNLLFANECEAVSGRSGTSLKNVVNGHIKDYVQQLGESERQSLATGMEADPWNAKDFTDEDKELLSRILSASTQDVEAWSSGSKVWQPCTDSSPGTQTFLTPPSNGNQKNGTSTPNSTSVPSKAQTRSAVVDDQSYILPISAILCLHGLATLLHLNTGIPSMTSEIATSILSYLTLFNSRVQQLILGAGATTTAGLKNITTKHLALAAQATSFISVLIPYIREYVRRNAGTGSSVSVLMGEFDKIRRAYLEHQQLIYDKFLNIMSGRATAHIKSMKMINWDDGTRDAPINTYMETMTKETLTLHKVLNKHLPDMTVNMIMELVFKSFREQLGKAFGDVVLGSEDAKARMLCDAQYFKTRIGSLDGANDAGDYIIKIVQDKNVPRNPTPPLPATIAPPDTQTTPPTEEAQPVAENGNGDGNNSANGNI
ncbi:uncharacterized protein EAF02_008291 [Botrytis sinoallii]|uniref:uncharacterized protein n=1 Tax=Botrytis sinoallii TaxID=1463999 RepID=UPI0018FFC980|nr:uncharacterized protein EAF02_008291 [Botrytis sinoallii]KAF7877071.1 hypothetical protein EAF02_008291 [Botrytis sinoallii]